MSFHWLSNIKSSKWMHTHPGCVWESPRSCQHWTRVDSTSAGLLEGWCWGPSTPTAYPSLCLQYKTRMNTTVKQKIISGSLNIFPIIYEILCQCYTDKLTAVDHNQEWQRSAHCRQTQHVCYTLSKWSCLFVACANLYNFLSACLTVTYKTFEEKIGTQVKRREKQRA